MLAFRLLATSLAFTVCLLTAAPRPPLKKLYAQAPLRFEPNVGQADPAAPYVAHGAGFSMVLAGNQAVLAPNGGSALRMSLAGAREHPGAKPEDRLGSISNYYIGNDPRHWHAGVPNYGRVKFEQVYPGIDIVYYGREQRLEYDLIVAPGADPAQIRWAYSGADSMRLDAAGDLVLALRGREIRQRKPTIYQEVAGHRREVRGEYELAQGKVRLKLGEYDETATLVIDPAVVVYATYLGGSGNEFSEGYGPHVTVDSSGAAYIIGSTTGGFPTLNAYQNSASSTINNVFVAKFNAAGALVYSTYLAGSGECEGLGIAVDSAGAAYISGQTAGGFPLMNPTQPTYGGGNSDAFIAKLTPAGVLAFSTYLGGAGTDGAEAIALDSSGNMYVVGATTGSFPTLNAAQGAYGGGTDDAFAAKLTPAGVLAYSTYLGGSGLDDAHNVAVDAGGNAYITGGTHSANFLTLNPYQANYGGGNGNAFVAKLTTAGVLQYSTYLGGPVHDVGSGIAVNSVGQAFVVGTTAGGFPLQNAAQSAFGGGTDAFVAELGPSGSNLVYSTYLGGPGNDEGIGIALDSSNNAYIAGTTTGSFPVTNAFQANYGGGPDDGFVAELGASFGRIDYASYLGGAGDDLATAIAVDSTGAAYVGGVAGAGFPTVNAYQSAFEGSTYDAFVAKIATGFFLFPDTAVAGGPAFTLNVTGGKLQSGAVVYWNGSPLPTTFVSASYVTATVAPSLISTPGAVLVTVANPGQTLASDVGMFNVVAAPVVPALTSARLSYLIGCGGAMYQVLLTAGSGFQPGFTFYWNGTPLQINATTPQGNTVLFSEFYVPPSLLQTPGPVTITASNGGAMSNGITFTVTPPITLTNLIPSGAPAGSGPITLTVTGTNFVSGYTLNNTAASGACATPPASFTNVQLISSTEFQATIPAADLAAAGSFPIWVDNGATPGVGNFVASNNLTFTVTAVEYVQQGPKLVGTGAVGSEFQGLSVALSGDGNTALIGGFMGTSVSAWPVWVYKRSGGVWTQSAQLTGTGFVGPSGQGFGVALSNDGNTALVAQPADNTNTGAAWVFTQSNGVWTQQGGKLVGAGAVGAAEQGSGLAISGDGNTILLGGQNDNSNAGATWVFTRSNGVWTQQGSKLVGSGAVGAAQQASLGGSLALSYDGTVAAIGGNADNGGAGAVWIFTQTGGVWTQQGSKLVGTGAVGAASQGAVSLSDDGTYLMVGGPGDNSGVGAVWPFTQSNGVWIQQGAKLTASDATGAAGFGGSVSLGAPGGHVAAIGGRADNGFQGGVWVFSQAHDSSTWNQLGSKLVGTNGIGTPRQGTAVAISYDSSTILEGGDTDNGNIGAAWPFTVSGAPPSISSFSPTAATAGGPAFTLFVIGNSLLPGAVVKWNGTALSTAFVSFTQLTASVPANLFASAGTASITVLNPDGNSSGASTFTINGPVTITGPASLSAGTYEQAYSATITASGGLPPYTFSATGLPSGLSIGAATGIITGSPTVAGTYSVVVTVADSNLASAQQTYSLSISPVVTRVCTPNQTVLFTYTIGGAQPVPESCVITTSPSGLSFTFPTGPPTGVDWWSGSVNSGVTPTTFTISTNTLGLAAGDYFGFPPFTFPGYSGTYDIPIQLDVNPNPSQVTFGLAPTSASVAAAGGAGTAALTLVPSGSTNAWTVASTASWLHVTSPASGVGAGAATIGYSVDLNTGGARGGSLNVSSGGDIVASLTVNQAAGSCSGVLVSPTSLTFGSGGGSGAVALSIPGCPWTAFATDPTLITGLPSAGTSGTITFGVAPGATAETAFINVGPSPATAITVTRTALICTYTIATVGAIGSSQSFSAVGGSGAVNVTAPAGCNWTASSNSSFITVTGGAASSGSGSFSYSVASNPALAGSPARTGTLTVAGVNANATYNISQDPQGPQTYNCTVSAAAPPVLRPEGVAELAGDLLINCTGYSLGGITGDVLVTLNTSLTNHTLNSDSSGQTTDALLLVDNPTAQSLTVGQNAYRGTIAGPQAVIFKNVPLAPLTGNFSHVFRITNVRVDASHLGSASATGTVSIASAAPFSVAGATETTGVPFQGASSMFMLGMSSSNGLGELLPLTFAENFATAYRIKLATGQDPSTAGATYNSESGYVNSAVLGTDAGFATNGTRLVASFANIPSGTAIYAPVTQSSSSGNATAQLMSADNTGTGGSPFAAAGSTEVPGYQPVALVNGAGTATWEITSSNPSALDTLTFNLILSNPTPTLVSSCASGSAPSICGALGPQPQLVISAPRNTAPVPRFANPAPLTMLSIAPNPASALANLTSAAKFAALRPMELPARHASAAVPAVIGTGNTISVGGTVTIGELLQSNAASALANGTCVGTTLPPSYTITACAADNGGTCTPTGANSISTCYPSIDPGQSSNIAIIADTTASGPAELASNATSDSGNFAAGGAGAFAQTVTPAPGPSLTLGFSGSPSQYVPAGAPITYNVTLSNGGPGPTLAGDPIAVTVSLPALNGVSVTAPSWNCTQILSAVTCTNVSPVPSPGVIGFSVAGTVPASAPVGSNIAATATLTFAGLVSASPSVTTGVVPPPPSSFTLSSPTNGAIVSAPVILTWAPATGATSYTVYLGISPSQQSPVLPSTSLTTYSLVGLTAGTTYYWYVSAVNSSGATPSAISSFTVGTPCQFTLSSNAASLPSAGTATTSAAVPGGVYPQNPVTVGITPTAGTCTTYTATSSASWLSATFSGNTFAYTALSNSNSTSKSATITIANSTSATGYSQIFTVTEAGDSETILQREVRALYQSILFREPDSSGFLFWTGGGSAGLGQMADDFLTSPEAFNSDFAAMAAYQAATGGPPTYAGFSGTLPAIKANTQTIAGLFNSLIAGNTGYSATTLYQNLLNRAPTPAESTACTNAGLATCFETIIGFVPAVTAAPVAVPNNEFQSTCGAAACIGIGGISHAATGDHTNTMYITMLYFVILDRDTDASGLQFWTGIANMGGPGILFQGPAGYFYRDQILGPGTPGQGYIGSLEFQSKFQ